MLLRALAVVLGGCVAIAATATGAGAYFADDAVFALRGGAAAVTTQTELGPAQLAIRERLAELTSNNPLLQADIDGVAAFYEARGYTPAWTSNGALTAGALAVMARLAAADEDGLDPAAYRTPDPNADFGTPGEAAAADVRLSLAVAAYVREAYAGRIDPRTISREIDIAPHYPDTADAMRAVASATDPAAVMAAFNPTHAGYLALRAELARLRAEGVEERIVIPAGPTLRLGDEDERVALLRVRLDLPVPEDGNANLYDEAVASAVRQFQDAAGLVADGLAGPNTIGALNGPNVDPVAEIIANMERWRWLPRELGDYHVVVNVPEFMVRIVEGGDVLHETRVVVGQTSNRTPIFSDEIEHIIVNPYWNVPASIVAEEMMPILRSDPGYFVRNNFEVYVRYSNGVYEVNPYQVNWWGISADYVSMRQRPGPGNALGQIKFMFPNRHAVYLHDTPSRSLFQRDVRAFSHGCIRVMNPMDFADALLSHEPLWDAEALTELFGDEERQVNLEEHIPVHITYFTAVVDETGTVQFKGDVYGYSAAVRQQLGLDDAVVAAN